MDHWEGIKRLALQQDSEMRDRLATNLDALQLALATSLLPGAEIRVIVAVGTYRVEGYLVAVNTQYPGPVSVKQTLCHSIYVNPGANSKTSLELIKGLEAYARESNAKIMYGHIRPGGPVNGWIRKFGLQKMYTVVGKALWE